MNFFATSHGKSACDGIGETVKRLLTKASLQRPLPLTLLWNSVLQISQDSTFSTFHQRI